MSETTTEICHFYPFCKSPSKSETWACTQNAETRTKMCAVYVALTNGHEQVIKWTFSINNIIEKFATEVSDIQNIRG